MLRPTRIRENKMKIVKFLFVTVSLLLTCSMAHAQLGNRIGNAVQRAAENAAVRQAERRTEDAVNNAIDGVLDGSNNNSGNSGNSQSSGANAGSGSQSGNSARNSNTPQTLESYSQYDFVPGDQILFYEDFSQDAIGDFPALWTTNSSGEVKTLNNYPGKWFQITARSGVFTYLNKIEIPANFIIEFDYIPFLEGRDVNWDGSGSMKLYDNGSGANRELDNGIFPGEMGLRLHFSTRGWHMDGYNRGAEDRKEFERMANTSENNPILQDQINHVIVWVQNRRVRIYHNGAKVMDGPTVLAANTNFSRIVFENTRDSNRPFFSNIKITTAAPDVRSKLLTEGKIISYGINFDSGKDVIKPESYGAVKAIADVLKENPDVRITVVGHTDSDGNADANLDLSARRAAAVKNSLVSQFGIDASRIETAGKGQTEPLAPNNTVEGKAKNRRVEFVKQ